MMRDAHIELYFSPGACSRVSLIALEETGVAYSSHRVLLARSEHKAPEFLALNPKGRVPVLVLDGNVLTENVAILEFLACRYPDAGLLPRDDPWSQAQALSWLSWCASGLHPLVTRLRLPLRFCDLPNAADRVRELARSELSAQLAIAEQRLSQRRWLLGDAWSIVDAYLVWVWGRAPESGIDPARFPQLCAHERRLLERPAVQRALRRELTPD